MARRSSLPSLYTRSAPCGVGFETGNGRGFFVKTIFVECAMARAQQEFVSGRSVVSAAIFDGGKIVRIVDADDFREHKPGCGCSHCYGDDSLSRNETRRAVTAPNTEWC